MQLGWSGHLVRMDDERLPKRLFYGDVATGSRRQGGPIRRYKDTLKSSLKRLQINPTNWEELALDRPTWRRTVKTGAAIYEANRTAAAKVKREARKSQVRPVRNADAQPLPTCPRCQRTFRARIGLVGHLRINCASRTAPIIVPPPASTSSSLPPTNSDSSSEPPLPSSSSSSSSSSSTAPRRPLRRPSRTSPTLTQRPTPPTLPPTPAMRIRTTPALTATAPSPHTSAWSVTCESIARRLANQCLEHQPTPTAPASTAHTALAPLRIAWVYSATCASTRAELTAAPTHPSCQTPPPLHHPAPPPLLQQLTPTPPTSPAHTAHAHSPLASAWSVTCESIAQRLANQCLEHQPIPGVCVCVCVYGGPGRACGARRHGQSAMPATAPTAHCSLLTGSDSGCGVGMGRESEVNDSAHFPHYKQSDVLEAITEASIRDCESAASNGQFCSQTKKGDRSGGGGVRDKTESTPSHGGVTARTLGWESGLTFWLQERSVSVDGGGVRHPGFQESSPCLIAGSRPYPRAREVELVAFLQGMNKNKGFGEVNKADGDWPPATMAEFKNVSQSEYLICAFTPSSKPGQLGLILNARKL
ncbi:hypothetical protein SprV_0200853200 [Sparganum proliferum]